MLPKRSFKLPTSKAYEQMLPNCRYLPHFHSQQPLAPLGLASLAKGGGKVLTAFLGAFFRLQFWPRTTSERICSVWRMSICDDSTSHLYRITVGWNIKHLLLQCQECVVNFYIRSAGTSCSRGCCALRNSVPRGSSCLAKPFCKRCIFCCSRHAWEK